MCVPSIITRKRNGKDDYYHLPPYDQIERGKTSPDPTLEEKIVSYFEGKPVDFPEPVYLDHLSPFCQIVLQMIRSIPRGQAMTYKQVAKMVNHPRAARAVGQVMSMNPIPLIIPCHRVIAHDHLGGFGFGLPWKAHLLSLEHFNLDSLPHRSSFYPPPGKEPPTV
ncbi:MAG: methylated-DNA--[protein]-cysteine S-methyltransferase [Atribacterota bacterium]